MGDAVTVAVLMDPMVTESSFSLSNYHPIMPRTTHPETHHLDRIGWLRAAVLGANDGIVSTASLMIGVAAASASAQTLLLTGVAAVVAGAMSMAAGEYVSVSSQADAEKADLAKERAELASQPEHELRELAGIYQARGLSPELAAQVAQQLTARDALGAHARDELGISASAVARPVQAAFASAASFAAGAALPLATALFTPKDWLLPAISGASLIFLILLGAISAKLGGAPIARVALWGALAMGITALVGSWFGVTA
jgi:vacuolar iron transporter family protein